MKKSLILILFSLSLMGGFLFPAQEVRAEPFIGEIRMFAGNFAPRGWAFCDGQVLAISQYQALFSILGTTYGGDGRTSFALPDLRGRTPIHQGHGPGLSLRYLGSRGGKEVETLTVSQIPSHTHHAMAAAAPPNQVTPEGNLLAEKSRTMEYSDQDTPDASMNDHAIENTGGGQAHNNMPPFLTVNYIIALDGLFPPRN